MRRVLPSLVVALAAGPAVVHAQTATATAELHPSEIVAPPSKKDAALGPRAAWHPIYAAEVEPHFVVAGVDQLGAGLGLGMNVAIPIRWHAPIRSIDDTIAVGIGMDWVRYAGYRPNGNGRDPKVLTYAWYFPVFLQWNVWLGARASMFVEPALIYRFAQYQDSCNDLPCTVTTRVLPSGSLGFRLRIVDHASFTIRVGWPMVTFGGSWL